MKLIKIDLKKCTSSDSYGYHDHPTIRKHIRSSYLAQIGGWWYAGKFDPVWFGLHFDGWHDFGLQLDMPGTNGSSWQKLYRIVP